MTHSLGGRAEQAGALIASANIPGTFQQTLMPRSAMDQGIATGSVMVLDYAIGVLIQDLIESVAMLISGGDKAHGETRWRRTALTLDAGAIAAGLAVQSALRQREGESLKRGGARSLGYWLTSSAAAGGSIGLLQEAMAVLDRLDELEGRSRRYKWSSLPAALPAAGVIASAVDFDRRRRERADDHLPEDEPGVSLLRSAAMSVGVSAALTALTVGERGFAGFVGKSLSRFLPGSARLWRPAGHAVSLGVLASLVYFAIHRANADVEKGERAMEPAFDSAPTNPEVSGSPASKISYESLSKQGRRFVSTSISTGELEEVMGEPATAAPIRVFVGLDSETTEDSRVALAMEELERTGAFDRSLLMIISPTGTGYVNYVAVEAAEYFSRGDIASVAMQYSQRPSVMSLDRVWEGRHHQRMLIAAIHDRLSGKPAEKRPRVVLFGESLGAHTSQDAFLHKGTDGLLDKGIDAAVWIGTPYESGWKKEVLGPPREDTDRSLIGVFNDIGQLEVLPEDEREKIRYVMVTHDNDAVTKFGPDLLVRAPDWLGDKRKRPATIPRSERWTTPTTFMLTLIDMKNSANVIPGQFDAKGHDYRADLARFIRTIYHLEVNDDQLARAEKALRRNELERKERVDKYDKKA